MDSSPIFLHLLEENQFYNFHIVFRVCSYCLYLYFMFNATVILYEHMALLDFRTFL